MVGALLLGQAMGLQGMLAVACVTAAALGVTITDRRDSGE
jgi:threonine/homoserine efflux transporter RhtA